MFLKFLALLIGNTIHITSGSRWICLKVTVKTCVPEKLSMGGMQGPHQHERYLIFTQQILTILIYNDATANYVALG
jgi:hypothetical protein